MKICILSDSHDHIPLLNAAAKFAEEQGAEAILHCGDVVAPSTLECLSEYNLPAHIIHGNNSGDLYSLGKLANREDSNIHYYGMDAGLELASRKIFLVHYPHYARAVATTGDWDMVCCGHSHKIKIEEIPNIKGATTPLVNPGTVGGVGDSIPTFVMADLAAMDFEVFELSKKIEEAVD